MSGFNRITQAQPARGSTMMPLPIPLGVKSSTSNINNQRPTYQHTRTPIKRSLPNETSTPSRKPKMMMTERIQTNNFATPMNRNPPCASSNAPLKKRSVENIQSTQHNTFSDGVIIEDESFFEDHQARSVDEGEYDESAFPANQQGLYDGGFGSNSEEANLDANIRVPFERVKEETIEMGGFLLPGLDKKSTHKSYNWIAGRSDGQYRVVLGYNTLFKPKNKNGIDSSTGEKDSSRWRVIRFENRYKENYPYTEFPAKYLTPIIQALEKAREAHDQELKEDSVL